MMKASHGVYTHRWTTCIFSFILKLGHLQHLYV